MHLLALCHRKYKGPPPRASAKAKSQPKVAASMATVAAGSAALPIIDTMPTGAIPWRWNTAAGGHLIGKQASTPKTKEYLQQSPNPVAFATGSSREKRSMFPSEPAAASSSSHDVVAEGAAPSAPSNPLDDKLLVELGDAVPF